MGRCQSERKRESAAKRIQDHKDIGPYQGTDDRPSPPSPCSRNTDYV